MSEIVEIDIRLRYHPVIRLIESFYKPEMRILEIGSGATGITNFFPIPIIAADIYFNFKIGNQENLMIKVLSSAEKLPFLNETFDIVLSIDMFEHISTETRDTALREFFRVLKLNGRIILAVPCGRVSSIYEKMLNVIYKFFKGRDHPWLKEHISFGLPQWQELYRKIKSVDNDCSVEVIDNVNVLLWFWLHLFGSLLPISVRGPIMQRVFPIVKNINFLPYRKIFAISKK